MDSLIVDDNTNSASLKLLVDSPRMARSLPFNYGVILHVRIVVIIRIDPQSRCFDLLELLVPI